MKGYPASSGSDLEFRAPAAGAGAEETVRELVENYLPLVAHHVDRIWVSSRLGLTRDDLVSAGSLGLLLAARRFDPTRGVDFSVFARAHIHGALMREINRALRQTGADHEASLLAPAGQVEPDSLPDAEGAERIDRAEAAEIREAMEFALSPAERLVLTLYYFEELTLQEIATVVEVSSSSVARTIRSALKNLRTAMADGRNK